MPIRRAAPIAAAITPSCAPADNAAGRGFAVPELTRRERGCERGELGVADRGDRVVGVGSAAAQRAQARAARCARSGGGASAASVDVAAHSARELIANAGELARAARRRRALRAPPPYRTRSARAARRARARRSTSIALQRAHERAEHRERPFAAHVLAGEPVRLDPRDRERRMRRGQAPRCARARSRRPLRCARRARCRGRATRRAAPDRRSSRCRGGSRQRAARAETRGEHARRDRGERVERGRATSPRHASRSCRLEPGELRAEQARRDVIEQRPAIARRRVVLELGGAGVRERDGFGKRRRDLPRAGRIGRAQAARAPRPRTACRRACTRRAPRGDSALHAASAPTRSASCHASSSAAMSPIGRIYAGGADRGGSGIISFAIA